MRTLFIILAFCLGSLRGLAQDIHHRGDSVQKYCAVFKDGIMTIQADGKHITHEVTLANGTEIKTDGTLVKKDGTRILLKDGDCIDKDGNLVQSKAKNEEPLKPGKDKTHCTGVNETE
ncbi:MAG: DUF6799 domain-containing protein [Bacteroidota bacterium]